MADTVLLDQMRELIAARELGGIAGLANRIGPAEWADLIPNFDAGELADLLASLPFDEIPELLAELPPYEAARILRTLPAERASSVLGDMDPDDATDIIGEFPDELAESLLGGMNAGDAREIRELLEFPPDTAGGIMTPAFGDRAGVAPRSGGGRPAQHRGGG